MRGKISLAIWKRVDTKSKKYKDKWNYLDKLVLFAVQDDYKRKYYKTISARAGFKSLIISRDELAFIKVIYMCYGTGDYCIKMWGKGKKRGIRVFWDGLITIDKKFFRRKNTGYAKVESSLFERDSVASDSKSYVGNFFKTKRPGIWYNF